MQVRLLRPAPHMDADKGDVVDLPERQAENWILRGTAEAADDVSTEDLTCSECGFEAKSAGGLATHERSHEDEDEDEGEDDEDEVDLNDLEDEDEE